MTEPIEIERLLDRRSDLSTFIVHLTKDGPNGSPTARENLESILTTSKIEARTPMGWTGKGKDRLPSDALAEMKVVCFSETPLEHVYSMFQSIRGRTVNLAGYGVAFTKDKARSKGINPVWYVDMTPGRTWELAPALDDLRTEARNSSGGFGSHHAAKILPFIEQMGTWSAGSRKEFSWEREWRHLGDLDLGYLDVALVLCPEAEIKDFEALGPYTAIDPSWSLERMIATIVESRNILSALEITRARSAARRAAREGQAGQ